MKDIVYCRTEKQWNEAKEKIDDQVVVPLTQTVIDYDGSLYQELDSLNIVSRLMGIKQLGLADSCCDSALASGTRYGHSLVCATQVDYIAQKYGLKRELGVIASMTHDCASTVFSDSVSVGLEISDEEKFEHVIKKCPELDNVLKKYSVSKRELIDVVKGRSSDPISQFINSKNSIDADRFSYTSYDSQTLDLLPDAWIGNYVANPFKHIAIIKGKVVFTDIDSVAQFLEARAQMFERVYRSSEIMAKEAFLEKISRGLLKKGVITQDSLFEMVDSDFEPIVCRHGGDIGRRLFKFGGFETYGMVEASEDDVSRFIRQYTNSPFAVRKLKNVNPAVLTPVMVDGIIDTYKNWEPLRANILEQRMSSWGHAAVYGLEGDRNLYEAVYKAQKHFGKPKELSIIEGLSKTYPKLMSSR